MTLTGKIFVAGFLALLCAMGLFSAYGGWFNATIACMVGTVALPALTFFIKGRHPYTIWAVWALVGMAWGVTGAGIALYLELWLLAVPALLTAAAAALGVFRLVTIMVPDIAMFAGIMSGQPANTPAIKARLAALGAYYGKLNALRAKVGLRPLGASGEYTRSNDPNAYWREREDGLPPVNGGNRAERRKRAAEERKRK
ncbi:MAG: hypothetical protein GC134_04905 [Proteobacteria bacterium]|nr:hypothetical protein [Pseudomonadota bacterium]